MFFTTSSKTIKYVFSFLIKFRDYLKGGCLFLIKLFLLIKSFLIVSILFFIKFEYFLDHSINFPPRLTQGYYKAHTSFHDFLHNIPDIITFRLLHLNNVIDRPK